MEGKWFRQERKAEDMNNNNKVVKINNADIPSPKIAYCYWPSGNVSILKLTYQYLFLLKAVF